MNNDFYKILRKYEEISVRYDVKHRAVWCYYNPTQRPCYTFKMLRELRQCQQSIIDYLQSEHYNSDFPIHYVVQHSKIPGIYSLGGDLELIGKLIREKNRQELIDYATQCVDICYLYSVNFHLPLTTISLVEGVALGGGFEAALSSNVLIATENAEMGFPEIRFNLFPGMGAYSFLARTSGIGIAERMLTSGATYSARKLYEMGIVHYLGQTGKGMESVEKFIKQHKQAGNGHRSLQQVRQRYHPMDHQELLDISRLWVDSALRLEDKDLKFIDRLIKAQSVKMSKQDGKSILRTLQDRRIIAKDITFPLADWSGKTIMFDRRKNPDRRLYN